MPLPSPTFARIAGFACVATILIGAALIGACDTADPDINGHGVERVVIEPDSATMEVGEQLQFNAFLLTAEGDTVDPAGLNVEWNWFSTDTQVFSVIDGGLASAHSPGEEFCVVEATILVGTSNFTGRDSAFVFIF
jgi:hypothetical protein